MCELEGCFGLLLFILFEGYELMEEDEHVKASRQMPKTDKFSQIMCHVVKLFA